MRNTLFILLLIFLVGACKNNPEKETVTALDKVEMSIEQNAKEMLLDPRVNSVSIGVYKDGKTYSRHFGELELGKGLPPTDNTVYEIASVTKTMTGTLVAKAVLDKKLTLEDDIRKYLDKDYPNLEFEKEPIRIKHLLTHYSGLPANSPGVTEMYDNKSDSTFFKVSEIQKNYTKDVFWKMLENLELKEVPGTSYKYSNIAPQLVAHILEQVYGKTYDSLMKEFVFKEFGMTNSAIYDREIDAANFPKGYNEFGTLMPHMPNYLWSAAGRVKATTPDMLGYLKAQVEKTNLAVIESHKEIRIVDETFSRGYYWTIEKKPEAMGYMHNGYASGTQNWFIAYPKYKLGVFVVTNVSYQNAEVIWSTAQGIVDDLKPFGTKSISHAIRKQCETDIAAGIALYKELKNKSPEKYNFKEENELNSLGYQLMGKDKLAEAIAVFKLLVAEFPESFNPYDSLGEAYFNNKEYKLSAKNYKKSFALNAENENATVMLEKIKALKKK